GRALIDSLQPGEIPVFACSNPGRVAPWGELLSTASQVRGSAGALMDGCVRDIKPILAMGFPVFHGGVAPLDSKGRGKIMAIDVPIECAGVTVAPGDLIFGDADGVVVVPQAVEQKVLDLAFEKIKGERSTLQDLRRGDKLAATTGRDHRNRLMVTDITAINDMEPNLEVRRPDFGSLTASYPERKLTLETGRSAKGGPELTRRAIDLIAPIGYGQRALIVAPARAGKTMLLQAITEGVAINHPNAVLLILLVDERPEEVSEAISWGVGEVVASSFDQPASRHVEVTEMVLERARREVELGKDVVIVLDSLTRMARAFNTAERGTGRTLSGGLDSSAMARPKAFFGSARSIAPEHGGGSLTII
ncbi:hypothetical protein EBR44_14930, partial [bacterium]|nr:hypothetical protein [bacterium]